MTALTLFAVTFVEAEEARPPEDGTEIVTVRDVGAICAQSDYARLDPTPAHIARYTQVIDAYTPRGPVLPAPVGLVFRARESVQRWLELHYVALSDALNFVDNRVVGRVHVWRPGDAEEREAGSDLAAAAAESMRVLRRSAVTIVPLRTEKLTGIVLSAAFLVEQATWAEFAAAVAEQGRHAPDLRFELTGPWPPYDFVHMQLGT